MSFEFGMNKSLGSAFKFALQLVSSAAAPSTDFISTWNTSRPGTSNSQQIKLPLESTGTYNFNVDWGDGTDDDITVWNDSATTHTYNSSGNYTVTITGTIDGWRFNNGGDCQKLSEISNWGTLKLGDSGAYFYGCSNLTAVGSDQLDASGTTNMESMFRDCSSLNSDLNIDTVNATTMRLMLYNCTSFNGSISSFNTANVTNMYGMIRECSSFNQSVSNFDTAKVTNMGTMFYNCSNFDQSVSSFNTANVQTMSDVFFGCSNFNQSVSSFNTAKATTMAAMFQNCSSFNQSVSSFNTSNVTSMVSMFRGCTNFDQDLSGSGWDVTSLTSANTMLLDSGFSQTNYDLLLVAWEAQAVQNNVNFHAGSAKYGSGDPATARSALISDHTWTITDGGPA